MTASEEYLPPASTNSSSAEVSELSPADALAFQQLIDELPIRRRSKRSCVVAMRPLLAAKSSSKSPKLKTKAITLDISECDNGAEENKNTSLAPLSLSASARRRKRSSAASNVSKASAKSEVSGTAKAKRKRKRKSAETETIATAVDNEDNAETDAIEMKPAKKKRRSSLSSATSKAKASPKSKTAKASKSGSDVSDESRIEAWMRKVNRPFDAKRVKENMELSLSVDKTKKALAALSDSGSLVGKQFGKVLIYWPPQKKPADGGADSGKRLALARLTKDSALLAAEKSGLQSELKSLTSAPSDASLKLALRKLETEIKDKSVALQQMSLSKDCVTEEERSEALLELHKYLRAWKRRKAAAAAMIEAIFPESKARDVIRKTLGHDNDASAKADMRSLDAYWKAACIHSRKIKDSKGKPCKKVVGIRRKLKK